MIAKHFAVASLLVLAAGPLPAQDATPPTTTEGIEPWTVGPRTLPVPAGGSEALRRSLANTPAPDVEKHIQSAPTTAEQWSQMIAQYAAGGAQGALSLAKAWSVTVTEGEMAGVVVRTVTPAELEAGNENRLFVHVHGGAYVFGGGPASAIEAIVIAQHAKMPVLSIDYRMPPDHPFPAAVDDVVAVWRELLKNHPAASMALGGTSAGGGLALASTLKLRELGLPLPGAIFAGTPWADLTKTGDSQFTNEGIDRTLVTYDGVLEGAAKLYAGQEDLKTPLISPVYGDFEGFPPTYLVTGTRDLFLSDTARVHRKLRVAGVTAELNVYEGLSHAGYAFELRAPESQQVYGELASFLDEHLEPPAEWPLACHAFPPTDEGLPSCARRDPDGEIVLRPGALPVEDEAAAVRTVMVDDELLFALDSGKTAPALFYDNGPDYFEEGLARSPRDGKVGFVNERLELVVPREWDFAFPFANGVARVCAGCAAQREEGEEHSEVKGGLWGYVDRKGRVVVPVEYARDELPAPPASGPGDS